jgi:toxin ParE1/3/4
MKIEWRASARESLLEIVDYIADDDPGAALALLDEIEEKVGKIP